MNCWVKKKGVLGKLTKTERPLLKMIVLECQLCAQALWVWVGGWGWGTEEEEEEVMGRTGRFLDDTTVT